MRSEMQHAVVELREWPTLHTEQVTDQEVRIMDQKCKSLIKKDVVCCWPKRPPSHTGGRGDFGTAIDLGEW